MSVDGYPNAITGNYAPRRAYVRVCGVHLCVHFSPLGSDALINRHFLCCPSGSHTDNKQDVPPRWDAETHGLTRFALCPLSTQDACHSGGQQHGELQLTHLDETAEKVVRQVLNQHPQSAKNDQYF